MEFLYVLAPFVLLSSLIGIIGFRKFLTKYDGIIGIGKAWLIIMGIVCAVIAVGHVITSIFQHTPIKVLELLMYLAIGAAGIITFINAERKCATVGQRIALPFVCWCIAMGFGFRLVMKIFMNMPMSAETSSGGFPSGFTGDDGKYYSLMNDYGYAADYDCEGTTVNIRKEQLGHLMRGGPNA